MGPIRTSTGSISVTKIAQKNAMRNGKRKYTSAKADSSEMVILPREMTRAVTRLTTIMRPTEAWEPLPMRSPERAVA